MILFSFVRLKHIHAIRNTHEKSLGSFRLVDCRVRKACFFVDESNVCN